MQTTNSFGEFFLCSILIAVEITLVSKSKFHGPFYDVGCNKLGYLDFA